MEENGLTKRDWKMLGVIVISLWMSLFCFKIIDAHDSSILSSITAGLVATVCFFCVSVPLNGYIKKDVDEKK